MKLESEKKVDSIDISEMIYELEQKHRLVYWTFINNEIYVYKPLGRRDHKRILTDENLDEIDKEDEVILTCLLYPDPKTLDLENMLEGVASKLVRTIIENSYLDSLETRANVLNYYRGEMFNSDNQITCLIHEAFPQHDIEDIENWSIDQTAKYLSRAEWILQNLRGLNMNYDLVDQMQQEAIAKEKIANGEVDPEKVIEDFNNPKEQPQEKQQSKQNKKSSIQSMEDLRRMFPEADWGVDTIATEGIEGMKDHADTLAPALRPGFGL